MSEVLGFRRPIAPEAHELPIGEVAAQGWNVLRGDLVLPAMVLHDAALQANIDVLAGFCRDRGVWLAPHAKTTMAPEILRRQVAAGAWGLTVATAGQLAALARMGFPRLLLANEVAQPEAVRWIADEMRRRPGLEVYVVADSVEVVEAMERVLAQERASPRLAVLVEIGLPGGRSGCRDRAAVLRVARAVGSAAHLWLAGVEAFEGIVSCAEIDAALAEVDALLRDQREATVELARAGCFDEAPEIVVTAGGSSYFDRVAEIFGAPWSVGRPVRVVLRSGCYVAHDSGFSAGISPMGAAPRLPQRLRAAVEIWATVLSRPEPGLAIVGFGKRDCGHDLGLPLPVAVARDGVAAPAPAGWRVERLFDHHVCMRVGSGDRLRVGDPVGFGISHACTTFDKWSLIALVDDAYDVLGMLPTHFD